MRTLLHLVDYYGNGNIDLNQRWWRNKMNNIMRVSQQRKVRSASTDGLRKNIMLRLEQK